MHSMMKLHIISSALMLVVLAACHKNEPPAPPNPSTARQELAVKDASSGGEDAGVDAAPPAPVHTRIDAKKVKLRDWITAVIPSYDVKKGMARVEKGKIKDVFGREAIAKPPRASDGEEEPPAMRPGTVKEHHRVALKDGRLAVWVITETEPSAQTSDTGFIAVIHGTDSGYAADATGVWSNAPTSEDPAPEEHTLGGQMVLAEDEYTDPSEGEGLTYSTILWTIHGDEIVQAGKFASSGNYGPGSGADEEKCYVHGDFDVTPTYGDTLQLKETTTWKFYVSSADKKSCRPTIVQHDETTLSLVDGKLVGAALKDPRNPPPEEAKRYLQGRRVSK